MSVVWVAHGEIQAPQFTSVQEFCMASPRGAYTTALVRSDYCVVDWNIHVERLVKSIAAVHAALGSCYAAFYESLEAQASTEAAAVQAAALPSLLLALGAAVERFGAGVPKIATIVLSPGSHSPLEVNVAVTAEPPKNNSTNPTPTFATVLGPPREVPVGKDSGWVAQRQSLEALRPPGAAEVLLCTQDGRLLEGLVTNLYIVAESSSKKDGGNGGAVLLTAGMGDGVVWGTLRQRVLAAATDLGLRVIEAAPAAEDRSAWREAFLTNALRRVQALGRLECGAANVWGLEPWTVEFEEPVPGPWTAGIAARVEAALTGTDVRGLCL